MNSLLNNLNLKKLALNILLLIALSFISIYFSGKSPVSAAENPSVFQLRLSRLLVAFTAGLSLATSGVIFQSVFKNRLADPYLLGASSGASLFVALLYFILAKLNLFAFRYLPAAGFLGSAAAVFLTFLLSKEGKRFPVYRLLLTGIAVSFLFGSITPIILAFSGKDLYSVFFFMNGTTQGRSLFESFELMLLVIPGFFAALFLSPYLDYFLLGEERSFHIGINLEKLKILLLAAASYLTGISVSFAGIIGFAGLVLPNIFRKELIRSPVSWILNSALGGAIFLVAADFIARNLFFPREIPLTSVTALIGVPYLLWVLKRNE